MRRRISATHLEHRQAHEHIESVGHPAVGRILQRHDAEIAMAPIDFLEHGRDRSDQREFDRLSKPLHGSQVTVREFRPEACDLHDFLQRPSPAHDLAVNGSDSCIVERPLVVLANVEENFLFPSWGEDLAAVFRFHTADFAGEVRSFVDELEDVQVEFVDLSAQGFERCQHLCRSRDVPVFGLAHHGRASAGTDRVCLTVRTPHFPVNEPVCARGSECHPRVSFGHRPGPRIGFPPLGPASLAALIRLD